MNKQQVLSGRNKHLSPGLFYYYPPDGLYVVDGKKQYLFDENGTRYLDFFAGVATVSVGHCHPKVVDAIKTQSDRVGHISNLYLNDKIVEYAEELVKRLPDHLSVCHFVNSGAEANDLAMLMARVYTGNSDILALRNAYHGVTLTTMGLTAHSTWKFPVLHGQDVKHVVVPDRYRGPFGFDEPDVAEKYAWDVQNVIQHCTTGQVAGWISEPIQGVGGCVEMPEGYLNRVYEYVRNAGGVCIADEVQTGFCRTGDHYWGFEMLGVKPDIVTMAKGIGNGFPLGAVVTTPEISAVLSRRLTFNTYGGNPIASSAGLAVLNVIDEENVQENVKITGTRLKNGLLELQKKYSCIGHVRGQGLMLGVELVNNPDTKEPSPEKATEILVESRKHGLLIGKGGFYGNVLRIKPPLIISEQDVDFALNVLDDVVSNLKA